MRRKENWALNTYFNKGSSRGLDYIYFAYECFQTINKISKETIRNQKSLSILVLHYLSILLQLYIYIYIVKSNKKKKRI